MPRTAETDWEHAGPTTRQIYQHYPENQDLFYFKEKMRGGNKSVRGTIFSSAQLQKSAVGRSSFYFSDEKGSRWSPDRLVKFRLSAIC